jgi:signal transduction histidine kinase
LLSAILRRGYDRLYRDVTVRARDAAAVVDAARAITSSLEATVEERTAALSSTQRQLTVFAQRVADELTADLGAVRERLQAFLVAEQALGQDRLADVHDAAESVDRLTVMIERLHQHAALGAAALQPASIDMDALVREVVAECARGESGNIQWKIGSLPRAWADPPLMRAVLENLVTNAIKFSRGRAPACIEIGFRSESGRYFVRDNGVGFDARLAAKLFAPFRRAHRDSEFEGDGVGLANVRRIVERSGGDVAIAGEPDRGAEVVFRVPLFGEGRS